MRDASDALVLDLVEWIAREPRPYAEVIETWRTSCPRLTIWEDAVDRGYVARRPTAQGLRAPSPRTGRSFCANRGGCARRHKVLPNLQQNGALPVRSARKAATALPR